MLVTLIWTVQNTITLQQRNGTYFQTSTKNSYNTFEDKFTEDDGFQIAIGILDLSTYDYYDHLNRTLEEQVEIRVSYIDYDEETRTLSEIY